VEEEGPNHRVTRRGAPPILSGAICLVLAEPHVVSQNPNSADVSIYHAGRVKGWHTTDNRLCPGNWWYCQSVWACRQQILSDVADRQVPQLVTCGYCMYACMQFQTTFENFLYDCQGNLKFCAGTTNQFLRAALKCLMNSLNCVSLYTRPTWVLLMQENAWLLELF